jgi:hypothetical protein
MTPSRCEWNTEPRREQLTELGIVLATAEPREVDERRPLFDFARVAAKPSAARVRAAQHEVTDALGMTRRVRHRHRHRATLRHAEERESHAS